MVTRVPRQKRTRANAAGSFRLELEQQLSHARLSPAAQKALLGAVELAKEPTNTRQTEDDPQLTQWLGEAPDDPARLEFEALHERFARRRDLLQHCIGPRPSEWCNSGGPVTLSGG